MKITHLHIENYKGLHDIDIPLSRFACLIGENNAGKSSILQAVSLFFSGSALQKTHYFDADNPIRIEMSFDEIAEGDLARLAEEHRTKIKGIIKNGSLTLVRLYGADGKSALKYRKLLPREERFSDKKKSPEEPEEPETHSGGRKPRSKAERRAQIQASLFDLPPQEKKP